MLCRLELHKPGQMELATYLKEHKWVFNIECEYNNLRLCNEKMMEELKSWKDFKGKNFNEIALYILFMYQKDSPLVKKFSDVKKRREEAIKESGLDGELAESLQLMCIDPGEKDKPNPLKKTFDQIIKMIVDFLMYQGDVDWSLICILESLFVEYSTILITGISNVNNDKDLVAATNAKKVTREELMRVKDDLKQLKNEFYNGDMDLADVAEKKLRWTPEGISKLK